MRRYLESRGYDLALSPAVIQAIAKAAASQPRLGARALREVFRRVIRDYEFEPEVKATGRSVLVDRAEVEAALV